MHRVVPRPRRVVSSSFPVTGAVEVEASAPRCTGQHRGVFSARSGQTKGVLECGQAPEIDAVFGEADVFCGVITAVHKPQIPGVYHVEFLPAAEFDTKQLPVTIGVYCMTFGVWCLACATGY